VKWRVRIVSEAGRCDVRFVAAGARAVGYFRVLREVKCRTWRLILTNPTDISSYTHRQNTEVICSIVERFAHAYLDNAIPSTTSTNTPERTAKPSRRGDISMAFDREADKNDATDSSVKDLVLNNARSPKLDASYLEQKCTATNRDANMVSATETGGDNTSDPSVRHLVPTLLCSIKLDTNHSQREQSGSSQRHLEETAADDKAINATTIEAASTSQALITVLDTPELLETIVSFLPYHKILTSAQQVSTFWKNAIKASPRIQTLLWRGSRVLSPHGSTYDPTATDKHSRAIYGTSEVFITVMRAVGAPRYTESVLLNEQFFSGYKYIGVFRTSHNHSYPTIATRRLFREGDMSWAFEPVSTGARPSWLDMFVTSPPITAAQVSVYMRSPDDAPLATHRFATVYDRGGITYAMCRITEGQRLSGYEPP
jgi:hypothetical protein